jgi:hypothetical protein
MERTLRLVHDMMKTAQDEDDANYVNDDAGWV